MASRVVRPYHHGDLRSVLLLEAKLLLEEYGPSGLTLREMARRAGVAAPSAYHHFTSLEELAAIVAEQGFTELNDALAACPADAQGRRAPVGQAYIGWARANPGLYRLMFGEGFHSGIDGTPAIGVLRSQAHDLVMYGLYGRVGGPDVPAALLFAWSLVHGLALLVIDAQAGPEAEAIIPAVFRLASRSTPLAPSATANDGSQ